MGDFILFLQRTKPSKHKTPPYVHHAPFRNTPDPEAEAQDPYSQYLGPQEDSGRQCWIQPGLSSGFEGSLGTQRTLSTKQKPCITMLIHFLFPPWSSPAQFSLPFFLCDSEFQLVHTQGESHDCGDIEFVTLHF